MARKQPRNQRQENEAKWAQLVARAWQDAGLRARLLADPKAVLKEHGLKVPRGVKVTLHETTEKEVHLVLPPKPSSEEVNDEVLHRAASGVGAASIYEAGCHFCFP